MRGGGFDQSAAIRMLAAPAPTGESVGCQLLIIRVERFTK